VIEPGQRLSFKLSLRFAPADADPMALVADAYEAFHEVHPMLNDWPDRRPLAMLKLPTGPGSESNPRGWFRQPRLDASTEAGREELRRMLSGYAQQAIQAMKAMDAQGGIVWNLEGQEFPPPISPIGDPRMLPQLAPEMDDLVDGFFERFRRAGLRTGLTIRPTQVYPDRYTSGYRHGTGSHGPDRNPLGDDFSDTWPEDLPWWRFYPVIERMSRKIQYAKDRWGCSVFYIKANGINAQVGPDNEFRWMLISGHWLSALKRRHPDVLLIPELWRNGSQSRPVNWAAAAGHLPVGRGPLSTPEAVLDYYPDAFSVLDLSDAPVDAYRSGLLAAIRRGDLLMLSDWYDESRAKSVAELYRSAEQPPEP
jgi:hypothetical protein